MCYRVGLELLFLWGWVDWHNLENLCIRSVLYETELAKKTLFQDFVFQRREIGYERCFIGEFRFQKLTKVENLVNLLSVA